MNTFTNIFLGNHFTVNDDCLSEVADKSRKEKWGSVFLFQEPLACLRDVSRTENVRKSLPQYRLEYKFGSSFENVIKAESFSARNITVYRNVFVDLLIYTQKLLADRQVIIDWGDIPLDDAKTFKTISGGSHIGLAFLEQKPRESTADISGFDELSSRFPQYAEKGLIHVSYWLAYLKTYYPVEFLSSYAFLSFGHLPSLLDVVQELGNTLCSEGLRQDLIKHTKMVKGFFYPGKHVIWGRRKQNA